MVTPAPTRQGYSLVTCSTDPSWTFDPRPTTTRFSSPRSTANGQTLASAAMVTAPITSAAGSIQASGSIWGRWPGISRIMRSLPWARGECRAGSDEAHLVQHQPGQLAPGIRELGDDREVV